VRALSGGRIGGAALDVFEREPLPPSSPLWTLPRVLVSPHMSGDTIGWREQLAELFLDNLRVKGQSDFPLGGQLISLLADRLSPCPRSADLLLI
jgi:phosphoglycerate dehydrogenase-like enzyme